MSDTGRVVITGGSGLIGSALTAELAGAGYEVIVLSRSPERVAGLPSGARAVGWDARSAEGWGHEVDGARAIVNLAGENLAAGRWTEAQKRRLRRSRTDAAGAVVQAVQKASERPAVLLQASGEAFYGLRAGDRPVTEEDGSGNGFLAELAAEWEAASRPVEELGVRRCVLRTGVVLSTEGGALPRMALPFKLFVGGPVGDGSQWVPWIHLRDEVRAIRFLLETDGARGPFNLAAPEPVTNEELSRALGEVLGRPSLCRVPAFVLRLALGEMADLLLTGKKLLPERLRELGFAFEFPEIRGALEDLL